MDWIVETLVANIDYLSFGFDMRRVIIMKDNKPGKLEAYKIIIILENTFEYLFTRPVNWVAVCHESSDNFKIPSTTLLTIVQGDQ